MSHFQRTYPIVPGALEYPRILATVARFPMRAFAEPEPPQPAVYHTGVETLGVTEYPRPCTQEGPLLKANLSCVQE
ncbi:hypothetical protein C5D04_10185 [Rathayibacter sp. AY1D2]|nr:hypothetical protein C5C52_12730 [Rathayibacter sp. AY1E5]PPI13333.1 hypothetical protein C5D04_10185 [Rathayibacter sp. AY1D2]